MTLALLAGHFVNNHRLVVFLAGRWFGVAKAHAIVAVGMGIDRALSSMSFGDFARQTLAGFEVNDQAVLIEAPVDETDDWNGKPRIALTEDRFSLRMNPFEYKGEEFDDYWIEDALKEIVDVQNQIIECGNIFNAQLLELK